MAKSGKIDANGKADLVALAREVQRQQDTKRDFIADTNALRLHASPEGDTNRLDLRMGDMVLGVNELAHDQIGAHTKIPAQYYDRMRKEAPELLVNNVNTWFQKYPAPRLVRTLDGNARAFLSDRYRPLDNADLLEAALPNLIDMKVMILSCEVTERRLYLKVVDERMKKDLPVGWTINNRRHERFDTVSPALVLSNSEVGSGALVVQTSVYFGGCTNLTAIKEGSHRKYHVGSKNELGGEETYALLSDTTKRLTDAALWAQIGDVVKAAFDAARFDATCAKLVDATQDRIEPGHINQVVEVTAKKYGFSEGEKTSVLHHLINGGDLSKYGLHNAITRTAEDLDSYDRASQFEQIGGLVVELPRSEWKTIQKAAEKELAEAA